MARSTFTKKNKERKKIPSLIEHVFGWSLEDIFNENLYKDKVKTIPNSFTTVENYLNSFRYPLIEETHADLLSCMMNLSQSPTFKILSIEENQKHPGKLLYNLQLIIGQDGRNAKERYMPSRDDMIALSDLRPSCVNELNRPRFSYLPAIVTKVGDRNPGFVTVLASKPIVIKSGEQSRQSLFGIFLINLTTNGRIWRALNGGNSNIIKEVLKAELLVDNGGDVCSEEIYGVHGKDLHEDLTSFDLNESQLSAVLGSVATSGCKWRSFVKLIWGPPGTGKTKTVGTLLWAFVKMKYRTVTCAPTNIAVVEVASRLMRLVWQTLPDDSYGLGDIVLFGNKKRMKVEDHSELHDVFLEYRARCLSEFLCPRTGWKHRLQSVIWMLEDSVQHYHLYLENKKSKKQEHVIARNKESCLAEDGTSDVTLAFGKFIRNKFSSIVKGLGDCISCFCKHLPTSILTKDVLEKMNRVIILLECLRAPLHSGTHTDSELKNIFSKSDDVSYTASESSMNSLRTNINDCLEVLRHLDEGFSVPNRSHLIYIRKFCLQHARLVFCTASSSAKLYLSKPVDLLVIDEAAQLKECESAIPLQFRGARHAILIGDQKQLPATVQSKISEKAGFGRSLFERLVLLGHKRHLLNVQYRMHPSISRFPNSEFYHNMISDAPNVKGVDYRKELLPGSMYGTYSLINVSYGKEESDDGHSLKNMLEVAVVAEIVENLYTASMSKHQKVSVGVISPYEAQVFALTEKLNGKYNLYKGFSVSVRSVDGFQGGEEDVIIISTVRSNGNGSVGFLSNPQRTNVALTRARYCLWILGNATTLSSSESVWRKLVFDAQDRGRYFDADEDPRLAKAIVDSMVELDELDDLLHMDSVVFRGEKWKVFFGDDFRKSVVRIKNVGTRKEIIALLKKLASGWRHPPRKLNSLEYMGGISSQILQQYNINGHLNLLWSVDILEDNTDRLQVLKFWDIQPEMDIPRLAKRLDAVFRSYMVDKMNHCKFKCLEGNLEVPMRWEIPKLCRKYFIENECAELSTRLASPNLGRERNSGKRYSREWSGRSENHWNSRRHAKVMRRE